MTPRSSSSHSPHLRPHHAQRRRPPHLIASMCTVGSPARSLRGRLQNVACYSSCSSCKAWMSFHLGALQSFVYDEYVHVPQSTSIELAILPLLPRYHHRRHHTCTLQPSPCPRKCRSVLAIFPSLLPANSSLPLGRFIEKVTFGRLCGPRALLNLIPVIIFLFALSKIPLPTALASSTTSTSTALVARLIVLGTVFLGLLSGFGAIANSWEFLPFLSQRKYVLSAFCLSRVLIVVLG